MMSDANSILLLKTLCLSEGFSAAFLQNIYSSTNASAIVSEDSTNVGARSFDAPWEDLLTSSTFVCDMILLSEDSPDIFKFPREEILPCGQENMFLFPLLQEYEHGDSLKFQLGLSNCIWDIKMTSTLYMSEDIMQSSPFEVSADTVSFEWNSRAKSGLSSNIFMTEASITIDLVPAERILMSLWIESYDNDVTATGTGTASSDANSTDPGSVILDEPVPSFAQERNPPITTESVKPTSIKRTETCSYPENSPNYPHFGEKQLQILQDMVQSELDEIDRLIFIVQVITGLLLAFLAWSLIENIFWPYRPSESRSSAGIPSSVVPINDEKQDDSFQLDATDPTPLLIHEGVPKRDARDSHGSSDNYGRSHLFPSKHSFQRSAQPPPSSYDSRALKGSYLGEALRASQGLDSVGETNAVLSTTNDGNTRALDVPVKQSTGGGGPIYHPDHSVSEKRKRYIDVNCAPGSEEIGNRSDEMHKTESGDATAFIADYWE